MPPIVFIIYNVISIKEYSSQWHILEQLKSSVAVVDPLTDTSKSSRESVGPRNNSDQESTAKNGDAETDETKVRLSRI